MAPETTNEELFAKLDEPLRLAWDSFEAAHPTPDEPTSQLRRDGLKTLFTYACLSSKPNTETIDVAGLLSDSVRSSGHPEADAYVLPRGLTGLTMDQIAQRLGLVDGTGAWTATHTHLLDQLPTELRSQLSEQRVMLPH